MGNSKYKSYKHCWFSKEHGYTEGCNGKGTHNNGYGCYICAECVAEEERQIKLSEAFIDRTDEKHIYDDWEVEEYIQKLEYRLHFWKKVARFWRAVALEDATRPWHTIKGIYEDIWNKLS